MIIYPSVDFTYANTLDKDSSEEVERTEKLISTFQIVRFPNDACIGSSTRNGTCYTSAECSDKGGTSSGSCADGFGVCCIFLVTSCGSSSSENMTYWTKPTSFSSGTCDLTVCPSDNICSIRLDFTSFTITGPNTMTVARANRMRGTPAGNLEDTAGVAHGNNFATNCLLDSFYVTSASTSSAPPMICGVNTGFHMYTEADPDSCNRLMFNVADYASASAGTGAVINTRGVTTLATTAWDITATHIECTSVTLPPPGCTNYFYGSGVYALRNYNNQKTAAGEAAALKNTHLAMQHQRMCIRRERGKCVGCFSTANAIDFAVSGNQGIALHYTGVGACCAYGLEGFDRFGVTAAEAEDFGGAPNANGNAALGFDCIVIPGAFAAGNSGGIANQAHAPPTAAQITQLLANSPNTQTYPTPAGPQICGHSGGIGIGGGDFVEGGYTIAAAGANGGNPSEGVVTHTVPLCSRISPFVLEFITDDLEDGGSIDGEFNDVAQDVNQGFWIAHQQYDC